MNDNAKKWVEALRSGEFKQGRMRLRTDDTYCCLGVACELYRRGTGKGEWDLNENGCFYFREATTGEALSLPPTVRDWLGLAMKDGRYLGASLASRNDAGDSFDRIAEIIESEPKGLFA